MYVRFFLYKTNEGSKFCASILFSIFTATGLIYNLYFIQKNIHIRRKSDNLSVVITLHYDSTYFIYPVGRIFSLMNGDNNKNYMK